MARQIATEMSNKISLDVKSATASLKELTSIVKDASAEARIMENQYKSSGDSVNASKAKYEGLQHTLGAQKDKIDALKLALENVNTSTDKGRDLQNYLNKELAKAERQYVSYSGQVEKAGQAYKYQESGLAALNKELKEGTALIDARVKKLEAEGRTEEANKVKLEGLKATQENYSKQLEIQKNELNDLAQSGDKSSDSYKRQRIRVEQMGAKLASTTNDVEKLSSEIKKSSGSYESHTASVERLTKELKQSDEQTTAHVERLKAEGKSASATVADYNHLKESLKNLRSQYNLQESELKQVGVASGKTSDAYRTQTIQLDKVGKSVAETKAKISSMSHTFNKLHPTGIKKIDSSIVKLKDHTTTMAERAKTSFASLKSHAMSASIGVGILGGALLKGAKDSSSLQNAYTENTNLLVTSGEKTKAVTKQIADMQKDGKRYSVEYGESQKNIADGYQELIKRGYTGEQSLGAMKSILQASKASGDDFSDTMKVTTSTLEAFGMRTDSTTGMMKNTKKVANELAMAADATSTDFSDLGVGMSYVGTSAKQAGLSLGDTASAMGVLSNSGIEADKAGTGLRKTINSLMSPTKGAKIELQKYGMSIDDFKDKSGKLKPIGTIFEDIGKKVPKGEQANFFHNVFGTTGQNSAAVLAQNSDELKKVNKQVSDSYKNNYVGKLADKNMKSTQNSVKQFKQAGNAVMIELGTAMMPALSKSAKAMAKAFDNPDVQKGLKSIAKGVGRVADKAADLIAWIGKNTGTIKTFGKVMISAFAVTKVLGGIAKLKLALQTLGLGSASKKLLDFGSDVASTSKKIGGKLKFAASVATGKAKTAITKLGSAVATTGRGIKKALKFTADLSKKAFTKSLTALKTAGAATGKAISKSLKFTASIATKGAKLAMAGLVKTAKVTGTGIKLAFNFLKANPFIMIITGVAAAVAALVGLYKHSKKFRKFVNDLVKSVKNLYKNITGWFKNIWNNVTKGWNKFKRGFQKSWNSMKKSVTKIASSMWHSITNGYNSFINGFKKAWRKVKSFFSGIWGGMKNIGHDAIWSIKNTLDGVLGKIKKGFSDTWTGVKSGFSDMWQGMKTLAGKGINAVIKIPNKGISGINSLIHDFGGPKHAIAKIPRVKFATGTGMFSNMRKAITKPTLAMLNDGNDSPQTGNQEMLIHPNGASELVQGRNTKRILAPGTEVLNASETAMLMGMQAMPFKSGTGFWSGVINGVTHVAGNAWTGLKNGVKKFTSMLKFITNAVAHPVKTLQSKFNPSSKGLPGVFNSLGGVLFKKATGQAKKWWKTLWSMASEASDSGADGGFKGDDYKYKNRVADSMPPDEWGYYIKECVSFVANRLANLGVPASKFSHLGNGRDWVNARVPHMSKPKVGSVAVYGPGSEFGNHVAMVTGVQGSKISGEEYNWAGDHKYHTYHGRNASGATTFLDFGLGGSSKTPEIKASGALQKLIKRQTGGMMKWIQKFIAPLNDSSTGKDGDVHSWADDVKKALRKLGLSTSGAMVQRVLRQISTESGGNPRAKQPGADPDGDGSGPALGLMQTKRSTFNANALAGHKNIWNGYDNILAGLNYARKRYGNGLGALGNGHGYANGGLITKHQLAEIGENNQPEMIIPLDAMKSSRGFELLGRTAVAMAARDKQTNIATTDNSKLESKLDNMITLLSQLVQGQGNQVVQAVLNKDDLYRQQANDTNLRNYQSLI